MLPTRPGRQTANGGGGGGVEFYWTRQKVQAGLKAARDTSTSKAFCKQRKLCERRRLYGLTLYGLTDSIWNVYGLTVWSLYGLTLYVVCTV